MSGVVAVALACTLAATSAGAAPLAHSAGVQPSDGRVAEPSDPGTGHDARKPGRGNVLGRPGQTSDGKPGIVVGRPLNARRTVRLKNDVSYKIAPGVTAREWDQVDGRQPIGQVRMNLLSVDLDAPNLSFEYLAPKYITNTKTVSQLGRWGGVLGAVNGDFFDISGTGGPLGVGIDRRRGLLNGSREGWIPENMSLWFDSSGPHLGPLSVRYTVRQHKDWTLSGLNAPTVPRGRIGIYTKDWGRTQGYEVTEGRTRAREVVLRRNRVISNRSKLSTGRRIKGKERVLVGVGRAAGQLARLRRGNKVTLVKHMRGGRPRMAITGDRPLLVNSVRTVVDNRLAHPRTAVGIDADGRKLLILVVDGRSSSSRGYTMVELANLMAALGAENALNLDGGGSSAMYSRLPTGAMGLLNEPSDGGERRVANGFGVVYQGALPPVVPIVTTPPAPPAPPAPPTTPPTVPPPPAR